MGRDTVMGWGDTDEGWGEIQTGAREGKREKMEKCERGVTEAELIHNKN